MTITAKMQELLDAINSERKGLLDEVAGLSEDQFAWRPAADAWSIAHVLQHLAIVEEATVKLLTGMQAKAEELNAPPDDDPDGSMMELMERMKRSVPDRTTRLTAPERVSPPGYQTGEQGIARLENSRRNLIDAATQLSRYDLTAMMWAHPFFGDLNLYQWLMVTGLHEGRHAGQIRSIRSETGFPANSNK